MTMNRPPLAILTRDGTLLPWDGRDENEKIVEVGSRYIYDRREFDSLMEKAGKTVAKKTVERKQKAENPAKKPKAREPVGDAKEVKKAVLDNDL